MITTKSLDQPAQKASQDCCQAQQYTANKPTVTTPPREVCKAVDWLALRKCPARAHAARMAFCCGLYIKKLQEVGVDIAHLDDPVSNPQGQVAVSRSGDANFPPALLGRVEQRLQARVQVLHARWPFAHGRQHLQAALSFGAAVAVREATTDSHIVNKIIMGNAILQPNHSLEDTTTSSLFAPANSMSWSIFMADSSGIGGNLPTQRQLQMLHLQVPPDIHSPVCHDGALHCPHNLVLNVSQRLRSYPEGLPVPGLLHNYIWLSMSLQPGRQTRLSSLPVQPWHPDFTPVKKT